MGRPARTASPLRYQATAGYVDDHLIVPTGYQPSLAMVCAAWFGMPVLMYGLTPAAAWP